MAEIKIYPVLPSAPEDSSEQDKFNRKTINYEFRELVTLKNKFNKKYEKYNRVLDRFMLVNAASSGISIASGIGSLATLSTFLGIPVSIPLGALSLTGASITGITTVLIKKYHKKLQKVMTLYDIVTSGIAIFETSVSRSLNDGMIDLKEFQMLQGIYYQALSKLSSTDRKMETETRSKFEKNMLDEVQNIKRRLNSS